MKLTVEQYKQAEDDMADFCTQCKAIVNHGSVEPDAQEYVCEECGEPRVMGVPEALIQDLIEICDEP